MKAFNRSFSVCIDMAFQSALHTLNTVQITQLSTTIN